MIPIEKIGAIYAPGSQCGWLPAGEINAVC
jgi:hypothetical protein